MYLESVYWSETYKKTWVNLLSFNCGKYGGPENFISDIFFWLKFEIEFAILKSSSAFWSL